MFKTRITKLLGIEYPIVGGCMMHISGPEFVAAISNAGALGMMASAMFDTQEKFRQAVRRTRELTDKPFGVNLSLFPALRPIDNNLYVEVILEEGVRVVETSGQRPSEELLARLEGGGVKRMHKCVSARHALSAQKAGVDAVTVFGTEGGGHIGELGLATMALVPRAADLLEIPLLAAGGIADGRGLLAALALGADGVTIGTRLLVTEECPIHDNLKQALIGATELDTLPILGSLHNTLRAWKNPAALKVAELEARQADMWEILPIVAGAETRRMFEEGDVEAGVIACSQSIGIVGQVKPVADVIEGMVREAAAIWEQLAE
ncbi:MAG: 2-nitropropane dioxygenase [Anaerolineaceae bacterium 4572_32.2]|nr:MAG: 2-nitropropane dioxygenase [Anaerolineaceae bacterium 4572_32.2]